MLTSRFTFCYLRSFKFNHGFPYPTFYLELQPLISSNFLFAFWCFVFCFLVFFFLFCLFAFSRAAPVAYGGFQAKGLIRAVAAGLRQSHSNARSKPHVQPIPQLTATPDPQPTEQGQGSNPKPHGSQSDWLATEPQWELLFLLFESTCLFSSQLRKMAKTSMHVKSNMKHLDSPHTQ